MDIVAQVAVINGGLAVMQNFENIAIACAPVVLDLVS